MSTPPLSPELLLGVAAGATVALQCAFFALAFRFQVDKLTDLAGTLNFALLALLSLLAEDTYASRAVVASALVLLWALRLGAHLLARVLRRGRDARFDDMRADCLAFFGFWVFQMLWVWVVSLPVVLVNATPAAGAFGSDARDVIGLALWVAGFLLEWAADASKERFHRKQKAAASPEALPGLLDSGVWRYSRHPNYFGEMLCWAGLTVLASPNFDAADRRWAYVSVASPAFTFVLLMLLSGVPLAEDRYDARFGPHPAYLEYKRRTSPLLPLPPALYRALPLWAKRVFLCEWPRYSRTLAALQRADKRAAEALEAGGEPTTAYQSIP